ncbi:dodecin [Novosphingobium sp. Gsoil 351]|uniref:dodecin n=1 Tax=Novosphingobium sp. Gsoil 351 TaxID=2675225 RepID=UPI0012B4E93A|nr:dodecin [Novosphingobium sp. Gsoil 351]QGN55524.1 dodecin flavoprotein [Novosphingobium sp. Gsoil 351]
MEQHVYKVVEIVGTSTSSIEDAIQRGITRASHSLRNIGWFQVVETRGHVADGKIDHFQVAMKIGFTLEGSARQG